MEILEEREETFEREPKMEKKGKRITPDELGDFWVREIEGYSIDDVMIEIYRSTKDGLKKVDYFTEDERNLASGAIRPPLYFDELKALGPGKYLIRVRHIKTGKILAVQTVKIAPEKDMDEEPIPEKRTYDTGNLSLELVKELMVQNRELMREMISLLASSRAQPQTQPYTLSLNEMAKAFEKGLEIASQVKAKEIEAQLEKIKTEREITIKRLEQEHELRKLKLQEGVTVGDVLDKLEQEGKYEEKNVFLDFINGISNALDGVSNALDKLNQFISMLGFGGKQTQMPFRQSPQISQPITQRDLEEEFEDEFEEIEIGEEEVMEEKKPEEGVKNETGSEGVNP